MRYGNRCVEKMENDRDSFMMQLLFLVIITPVDLKFSKRHQLERSTSAAAAALEKNKTTSQPLYSPAHLIGWNKNNMDRNELRQSKVIGDFRNLRELAVRTKTASIEASLSGITDARGHATCAHDNDAVQRRKNNFPKTSSLFDQFVKFNNLDYSISLVRWNRNQCRSSLHGPRKESIQTRANTGTVPCLLRLDTITRDTIDYYLTTQCRSCQKEQR